jgi:23S rRNA (cytosine1962-C5)-methyltransferase
MITEEHKPMLGYQLLDSGDGLRLEKFGQYTLVRPDPGALWKKDLPNAEWETADAVYIKKGESEDGAAGEEQRGGWKLLSDVPEKWLMHHGTGETAVSFYAGLTPFKHTGVFPEQAANWDFMAEKIEAHSLDKLKVLNLFGYTGIASVLCAKLGCDVTHVDASKPSIAWAKENMAASGLPDNAIRWILDDALKFVKREARRGAKYNAVILDPPAFGRGAKNEVWKFSEDLPKLLDALGDIVETGKDFAFIVLNAYAVSSSSLLLKNLMDDFAVKLELNRDHEVDYGELVLKQASGRVLSTGIFSRLY